MFIVADNFLVPHRRQGEFWIRIHFMQIRIQHLQMKKIRIQSIYNLIPNPAVGGTVSLEFIRGTVTYKLSFFPFVLFAFSQSHSQTEVALRPIIVFSLFLPTLYLPLFSYLVDSCVEDGLVLTGSEDSVLQVWRPKDQTHIKPTDRKKVNTSSDL